MEVNIDKIKTLINNRFAFIKSTYSVKRIGVFGSVARGDNKNRSDVDIVVEFLQPISMFKFIELEEYLGKLIGRQVDLVTKNALKPAIKEDILREVVYV